MDCKAMKKMHFRIILLVCIFSLSSFVQCDERTNENATAISINFSKTNNESLQKDHHTLKKLVKRFTQENNPPSTGQPGVDYPSLTTIPVTSFSCRGVKGGYYADLETNCQVFHICDNGRKISFLCPNGTIFQQSQLICDWWFKVDCSKSTELYEQSANQLAHEEKKRAEVRKMNSEFHRSTQKDYNTENEDNQDYENIQNARSNPYGQSARQNQISDVAKPTTTTTTYNPNQIYQNQIRTYQPVKRLPNQLTNYGDHQSGDKYSRSRSNNQRIPTDPPKISFTPTDNEGSSIKTSNSIQRMNSQKSSHQRTPKSRTFEDYENPSTVPQKTSYYTETTIFRTTTPRPPAPPRHQEEYQHVAESAAFVSNRGNRFNGRIYSVNPFNNQNYESPYRKKPEQKPISPKPGIPKFPGPTFAPIYKPRTTTYFYDQTSTTGNPTTSVSTTFPYTTDQYNLENTYESTTHDYFTTTKDYDDGTTPGSYFNQEPDPIPTSTYETYTTTTGTYEPNYNTATEFQSTTDSTTTTNYQQSYQPTTTNIPPTFNDSHNRKPKVSESPIMNSSSEKPTRSITNGSTKTVNQLKPTPAPYVPFTKNYVQPRVPSTSLRPPVYTATVPTISSSSKIKLLSTNTKRPSLLEARPSVEREHALSMLHSLQGLKNRMPVNNNHKNKKQQTSPTGSSMLHSLALYFSTTNDSKNQNNDQIQRQIPSPQLRPNSNVNLPTGLLTRYTLSSYADLFNLNNALEDKNQFPKEDPVSQEDDSDEEVLDIQQSQGPLTGAKRSNDTRFRELAQIFTHALSAYLQDPNTFKKILAEIRPTEPLEDDTTDKYPTTVDFPSVTKEKEEVLDFSDDANGTRRRVPSVYPTTISYYYPESATSTETDEYHSTPNTEEWTTENSEYYSTQTSGENEFAYQVNQALGTNSIVTEYPQHLEDDYFPENNNNNNNNNNRLSNNLQNQTYTPYGKGVKPAGATPIGANYTPNNFSNTWITEKPFTNSNKNPHQDLIPPTSHKNYKSTFNFVQSNPRNQFKTDNKNSKHKSKLVQEPRAVLDPIVTANLEDRRNNDLTQQRPRATLKSQNNNSNSIPNDHWTSSPTVTQLWETTVFIDPRHINHGLVSNNKINNSSRPVTERMSRSTTEYPWHDYNNGLVTDQSTWKWIPNENDSPTAFTLLPTTSLVTNENPAAASTPTTTFTTRSSIKTTITSSVTTTNGVDSSAIFVNALNVTDNEITKAKEIFGKLNTTSTNTLMKVMKQAENNETVRQLVLLLITHCNGPMNKTMEEEKEQLLNALLKMPVNKFTSEESKDIVESFDKFHLPLNGYRLIKTTKSNNNNNNQRSNQDVLRVSETVNRRPTTNRPERSQQLQNLEHPQSTDENFVSDARALELLRSLYTIAARWG